MQDSKFKDWLIKTIPYFEELSEEEVTKLYEGYYEVEVQQKTLDSIYDLAFNHNEAGIDYGNNFSKAMEKLNKANRLLKETMDELNSKYLKQDLDKNKSM